MQQYPVLKMFIQLYLLMLIFGYSNSARIRAYLPSAAASKSGNYAVPSGQTIRMSCITPEVLVDKSVTRGRRSYVWTDEEGKEVSSPRMEVMTNGDLQIMHAHEGDSGVYHCKFRTREALEHDGAESKIYVHKLIVYELPGHKFNTTVAFDVTKFGSETTISILRDLLKKKICVSEVCAPGDVTSESCDVTDTEKRMCQISITYEALQPAQTARCNETCVREVMIKRLKMAQADLESALLFFSEDSKSRVKPDLGTFDTKHVITCEAGYHLIESNFEHCFPCLPGTYSEAETLKCEYCPIGFYQEKYGSHNCEQCSDDLTTGTVGAKSRDDCRPIVDTGILNDLRKGIAAIFQG